MPKLKASKDEVKGLPPMKEGLVSFRLDGFKPKLSKDRGSVNLQPTLKVTNNSEYNDRLVFENLNTKGKWVWKDFCHALGVVMPEVNGDFEFPGTFNCSAHPGDTCPGDDPENWTYEGPLLGQVGQLYLIQADNTRGGERNAIKYYVCKVPGCTEKHSSNLAG